MSKLLLRWICSVIILLIVTRLVPGIEVHGIKAILLAPLVIGLINATLGAVLKLITLPLRILTLGLFSLAINALMLYVATFFVEGFRVHGVIPALTAAFWLALLNLIARWTID